MLVAYLAQRALQWRADAQALRDREAERDQEVANLRQLNELLEHRTAVAKAEAGINAIHMKVYSDAFLEAQQTGHFLPLSAILARVDVMQKAQGLDRVIPLPDLNA